MKTSVYDVLEREVEDWLQPTKDRLLMGACPDYVDYVRCSERVHTTVRFLDIIKEALQRLEKEQND